MRLSYWDISELERPCHVLVVGAGIVGLSAAIEIAKRRPNLGIKVLEKEIYGTLASTRNAGFACFGSISEIYSDIEKYGLNQTLSLVRKRRSGIQMVINRYGPEAIGYKRNGGYEVFEDRDSFDREESKINEINKWFDDQVFKVSSLQEGLSFYRSTICNQEEGQLNTGKLYTLLEKEALERGIHIVRGALVHELDNGRVRFQISKYEDVLELQSDDIIICANALSADLVEDEDIVPVRNQVIVTEPLSDLSWQGTFHHDRGYIYFRNIGKRILIGGARHMFPEEQTNQLGVNHDNQNFLVNYIKKHLADASVDVVIARSWSGVLSGGSSRLPIVKRKDEKTIIAARLGGMGVAIGMSIGQEAATLLLD